ncbi:MAG: chaperone modulator CbpM [Burkholderiales bacterium]
MSRIRVTAEVVEEDLRFSLPELCRVCGAPEEQVRVWAVEGVLEPIVGASPAEWYFSGAALRRARLALTLARELEVNAPGVALALDLMDEVAALQAALRRAGIGQR